MSKLLEQINNKKHYLMGEICIASGGGTPSTTIQEYWNGDIPWLTPTEVSGVDFCFISDTKRKITKKGLESSSAKLMPVNSILMSSRANIGDVVINEVPMSTNQGFINIIPKLDIIDLYYFSYWLRSRKSYFIQISTGSTFLELSKSNFKEIQIDLPDLQTQKKIAEILSAYDYKIENNNKIIKNLEAIAKSIFNKWFVDIEKIPKGWAVGKIKDLVRVESGFPFSSSAFDDLGKYKLVTIRNVQNGSFVTDCDNLIAELPSKLPKHCLLHSGDILLSLTGNVGRICIVNGENYVLNQRVSVLVPVNERDRAYVYFLFRRNDFQNLLISISKGTAQLNLSPVETKELEAIIPDTATLQKYSEVATPMYKKIVEINSENINLKQSRDQLLAKLI